MMNTTKILTVSQLNFYLKSLLDNDSRLQFLLMEGEISNLTDHYSSGHIYFSLKDDKSVVRAVMFSYAAKNLKFKPQNGMKVLVRGRVTVYEPAGQYQVYVEDMQPDGVGALSLQFEQLKEKLNKEGLFSDEHKKALPKFPQRIGVITSPTGAAVRDVFNILSRRFPCADIIMCPVLVQGDNAATQLTNAVNLFTENDIADVIIIGRGGGSQEDLWAFNDENLARAIYNCNTPIISAVGHETDFTICDFVSDLRAPTPSAAAELAVPDKADLLSDFSSQRQYVDAIMSKKILELEKSLSNSARLVEAYSPQKVVLDYSKSLEMIKKRLRVAPQNIVDSKIKSITEFLSKLSALNPINVLMRGYSYTTDSDSNHLNSVKHLSIGDTVNVRLSDGSFTATVKDKMIEEY